MIGVIRCLGAALLGSPEKSKFRASWGERLGVSESP